MHEESSPVSRWFYMQYIFQLRRNKKKLKPRHFFKMFLHKNKKVNLPLLSSYQKIKASILPGNTH